MNVLFVPGIVCPAFVQSSLKRDMLKHSSITNVLVRTDFYLHTQTDRCMAIVRDIKQDIATFKPTVIIAHSFGGMLAKKALSELNTHSVTVYCSLGSPHTMQFAGVASARRLINIPDELHNVEHVLTYGAEYDPVVPKAYTTLPNSAHVVLPVWHSGLLLKKSARNHYIERCVAITKECEAKH